MHGALFGGLMAVVPVVIALVAFRSTFLVLGVPAAIIAGAVVAPLVRSRAIAEAVIPMAALTTVLAEVLSLVAPPHDLPAPGSVELFAFGLLLVGIPLAVVTVPCAMIWAHLVRRAALRG